VGVDAVVGEAAFDSPLCPAHRLMGKDRSPWGEVAKRRVRGNLNLRRHERYLYNFRTPVTATVPRSLCARTRSIVSWVGGISASPRDSFCWDSPDNWKENALGWLRWDMLLPPDSSLLPSWSYTPGRN